MHMKTGPKVAIIVASSVIGAVAVGAIGFAIGRMTAAEPTAQQNTTTVNTTTNQPNNVPTTPANEPEEPEASVPENFTPYSDPKVDLAFVYPTNWGDAKPENCLSAEQSLTCSFDARYIGFDVDPESDFHDIKITDLDVYDDDEDKVLERDMLLDVYKTKSADGVDVPLWLPPSNAVIIAAMDPTYIESADGSWRGVYYYASVGQNDPNFDSNTKTANHISLIMTDGESKIIQLEILRDSTTSATTYPLKQQDCMSTGIDDDGEPSSFDCRVPSDLIATFEDEVATFAESVRSL